MYHIVIKIKSYICTSADLTYDTFFLGIKIMDVIDFFNKVKEADAKFESCEKKKIKSSKHQKKCNIPLEHLLMYQEL